ncbi:MAG TPA: endopeptidase La [Firmicutes bacterium]|nr:endopeptidase La [Bacillota bacterium]
MPVKKKVPVQQYPLLPVRGLLVFPHMMASFEVGRERSLKALEKAMEQKTHLLVLSLQNDAAIEEPGPDEINDVGTLTVIKQVVTLPDNKLRLLVEGLQRVRIISFAETRPCYMVNVDLIHDDAENRREIEALMRLVRRELEIYIKLSKKPADTYAPFSDIQHGSVFADLVAAQLQVSVEEKQALLELEAVDKRLEQIYSILLRENELLEMEKRIQTRVRQQMEKAQKEYYLREQIKAIQKELGEADERSHEVDELRRRIETTGLPKEAFEKAMHELGRLERMPPMAAELVVVRTYLDWILALPWQVRTEDRLDLKAAEEILERDHYGLEKVKERILEFLAVRRLVQKIKGPIMCLIGPPGVGKTSLARSVAEALGRKFYRFSLGGVRDEAEIRGHRRTYVGAMPGKVIQAMRMVKSANPVILLDEIDKMSSDFRGDPAAALLEVLDPEQNQAFYDHYLEIPFDLSDVLFITTANVAHSIPRALRDRMETIDIPGYTEEEKLQIARRHLFPKQRKLHGLSGSQLRIGDDMLRYLITGYTREAGVRNLERTLAAICRKAAREIVSGEKERVIFSRKLAGIYLGQPPYRHTAPEREDRVGLATGMAYTESGGEILHIEVSVVKGKGALTLTGKLGEVMRESAQAAFSYVRANAEALRIDPDCHEKYDVHIHVPEGAVPKDGPSAGITIAMALTSALSGRAVRADWAMTGEITLRGRVLPVGGIKEKLLAAHRAGIHHIILPRGNEKDLEELPEDIRKALHIVLVEEVDEVLARVLLPPADTNRDGVGVMKPPTWEQAAADQHPAV